MRKFVPLAAVALFVATTFASAGEVDLPRFPSVSPDGSRVAFSWRGDIWSVPTNGGGATRLTANPGNDLRTSWSPDGRFLAFDSDRSGYLNLHVMNAAGGDVGQVTFEDASCLLSGFAPDGGSLLFEARREGDVFREMRPYSVPVAGGAISRVHDAFGRTPRRSPNGAQTVFTRGGSSWTRRGYRGPDARDVWIRNEADGSFRRLTTWPGNDGMARWSGNSRLVYLSDRHHGAVNVWALDVASGDGSARALTTGRNEDVTWLDVSADGSTAVFSSWDRLYALDLRTPGAKPARIAIHAAEESRDATFTRDVGSDAQEAELNPDGKTLACIAYGELFVRGIEKESPTVRVTRDHARDKHVVWSPDGMTLYFVSDKTGADGIYTATVKETRTDIRKALEPKKPEEDAEPEPPEAADDDAESDDENAEDGAADAEPESSGDEDGENEDPEEEEPEEEDNDEKKTKKEKPPGTERWHDAVSFEIQPLLVDDHADRGPSPSPDGKSLLFRRGLGNLCVLDLATKTVRVLSPGWDRSLRYRWSPDSRHVALSRNDRDFNEDIWIVRADGTTPPVNISRHPDDDRAPRWSADGKILAFSSSRYDEQSDVYVVFLDKTLEAMTKLERKRYFEDAGKATKARKPLPPPDDAADDEKPDEKNNEKDADDEEEVEPFELDLDDAYRRVRRVTTSQDNEFVALFTASGETLVYSDGKTLRSVKWDGTDSQQLRGSRTSVTGLSLKGDKIVYIAGSKPGLMNAGGGGDESLPVAARVEFEHAAFAEQRFREAAGVVGEVFYHPTMKGRDWPALTERYLQLARRARTSNEFDEIAGRLLGELNASHLGIRSPATPNTARVPNGRLGVDAESAPDGWLITRVLEDGPADQDTMRLLVGDVVTSIDQTGVRPGLEFAAHLRGMTGREVVVEVLRAGEDGQRATIRLLLTPVSGRAENELRYQNWTRENLARVEELSDGRVGYAHIRSMNRSSLRDFERDLYAAMSGKAGLIVDVRNNGGGSTADLVLASLMVRKHAYTVPRGADPSDTTGYPEDRLYIQGFTGPVNMLCNQKSFSNAEIVSHAFKTLGRGTLVGEQTYGGVISTGGYSLVDGTFVRTPFRGWYLPDGTDMENNGAIPHLRVPQTPEQESADQDAQLDAAVRDLIPRLDR